MSISIVIDNPAPQFSALIQQGIEDIFGLSKDCDPKSIKEDRVILVSLLQANKAYRKFKDKQKRDQFELVINERVQKILTDAGVEPVDLSGLDNLDSSNSIFADYSMLLEQQFSLPKQSQQRIMHLGLLLTEGIFEDLALDYTPYQCLLNAAVNRSVVEVGPREIDDSILLNSSDLFTKLPQWTLCLDLSQCDIRTNEGKVTGIMVTRNTFFKDRICKPQPVTIVNGEDHIFFNAISCMVALDNRELNPIDRIFLLDSELSVISCMRMALLGLEQEQEQEVLDSKDRCFSYVLPDKVGTKLVATTPEEIGAPKEVPNLAVSESEFNTYKQVFKYLVYVLTHQSAIENYQELDNQQDTLGKTLEQMAKSQPFKHYCLH